MSNPYSWQAYNDAAAKKQRDSQVSAHQASQVKAANTQAGRERRLAVTNLLITPFLRAMRSAGNPGAGLLRGGWVGGPEREKNRNTIHANGPMPFFEIYTNGAWLFGQTSGVVGMRIMGVVDGWRYSRDFRPGEVAVVAGRRIKGFQGLLVGILREHRVQLPSD